MGRRIPDGGFWDVLAVVLISIVMRAFVYVFYILSSAISLFCGLLSGTPSNKCFRRQPASGAGTNSKLGFRSHLNRRRWHFAPSSKLSYIVTSLSNKRGIPSPELIILPQWAPGSYSTAGASSRITGSTPTVLVMI